MDLSERPERKKEELLNDDGSDESSEDETEDEMKGPVPSSSKQISPTPEVTLCPPGLICTVKELPFDFGTMLKDRHFYFILFAVVIVAGLGAYIISNAMKTEFYPTLKKPSWAPPPQAVVPT